MAGNVGAVGLRAAAEDVEQAVRARAAETRGLIDKLRAEFELAAAELRTLRAGP
jgi:hypothetical protein